MRAIRCFLLACMILTGCQSPVPAGRDVRELNWARTRAMTEQEAEENSRIRLWAMEAFNAGRGDATIRLPADAMDGSAVPRYLVVAGGTATLLTDYRRHRLADRPDIDRQRIIAMRSGYFERGRFIDSADLPPRGRELVLLLQTEAGAEVQF
jgi:predicted small secreted protein